MPHTPHTPHTPGGGTSNSHPLTPGGPPSVPSTHNDGNASNGGIGNHNSPVGNTNASPQHQHPHHNSSNASNTNQNQSATNNSNLMNSLMGGTQNSGLVNLTEADLNADLNFDPAAVIDGDSANDLNVSYLCFNFQIIMKMENCLRCGYLFLITGFNYYLNYLQNRYFYN